MISNSAIRLKARMALGSNLFNSTWLLSFVVVIIISAIFGFLNSISCGIGTFLVSGPLTVGLAVTFLKIARGNDKVQIETAFDGVRDFGPNLMLGLMSNLYIFLWSLLFIIPGIIKAHSYAMIYYIKADHPEYSWRECLDESERMMQGNKFKFFCLNFSFLGWILLSVFTCGIGSFWVTSYMNTAQAVFYDQLKGEDPFHNIHSEF